MINKRRLSTFLVFAFGLSWLFALIIFMTGSLAESPELVPNTGITLAVVLLASGYMWGPATAHLLTRVVTGSGWNNLYLKPDIKKHWLFLLAGWFLPGILTIIGTVLFFLFIPSLFDNELSFINEQLTTMGVATLLSPFQFAVIQILSAMLISSPINAIATFGEEFGWRAFLLPELSTLGKRKALIISSIIWGIWHWPLIIMGQNYGLNYPGYP